MRSASYRIINILVSALIISCSNYPDSPQLTLSSIDGSKIEINENTPLTALFFFQMSNPVAIGAFERIQNELDDSIEIVGIAMQVDRPPNVVSMQQRMIMVPIVIDEGEIAQVFGGIDLTPVLILIENGRLLLHQRGRLDYDAVNAFSSE
jgi:hypothetical protein